MKTEPHNIAFLGLGAMGQRMATRLLAAGHRVTVWNRSTGPAAALEKLGARAVVSPRAAAEGAEIIFAMVYDEEASRAVWLEPKTGAAAMLSPNAIAVECSTLGPAWISELNSALPVPLVDAPVAGSRQQAEAGQLIFMAGGCQKSIERVRPLLLQMGSSVHALGRSGAGSWLKLSVNSLFSIQVVALAEQLSLLTGAGIDLDAAFTALNTMPVLSSAAAGASALMRAGNYSPQAPVDLIHKDLGYALAASLRSLPLTQTAQARFQAARDAGYGSENLVAVAKLYA